MNNLSTYQWQKQPLSIVKLFGDIGIDDGVCVDALVLVDSEVNIGYVAIIHRARRELLVAYKKVSNHSVQVPDCDPACSAPVDIIMPDTKGQASISNLEECYLLYRDVQFTHAVLTGAFQLAQSLGALKGHTLIEKAKRINALIDQYSGQETCSDYHQTLFDELTYLAHIVE